MRIWKAGAILVSGLAVAAILLVALARWAAIRLDGFDIFDWARTTEMLGISMLVAAAAILYLLERTARLDEAIHGLDDILRTAGRASKAGGEEPAELTDDDVSRAVQVRSTPGHGSRVAGLIRFDNVSKVYDLGPVKVHALRDVTLDIPPGSLSVVLGPSGSGKTTLLNLLGGIDRSSSGEILVDGTNVARLDETELVSYRREQVGFVFQFFNLIPSLTARENVALAAELVPDAADVEGVLRKVGLGERMDHFPAELSGGEQQRVAIARALVKNPPLLLCDEPTGELDYTTGVKVLEVLRGVARQDGRAVIVVTHNAVIGEMADMVVHLRGGRIDRIVKNAEPAAPQRLKW